MSEELNEAFGKALKIMFDAEETINSVTPAERKKCNEIVQKYIGEPATEYGFRKSRFERTRGMVHEWIFERTVDAIRQSIVIREQPLAKGELKLSCGGGIKPIKTKVIYDNTMEGFEKAVLELKKYMDSVGYVNLEKKIKSDDRITSADYEDLFYNYKLYADEFMSENGLTEESSIREKYDAIDRTIKECNKRGTSFFESRKELLQASGFIAKVLLELKDSRLELAEDKSDCYIVRTAKNSIRCPHSVVSPVLFLWQRGNTNVSIIDHLRTVYTIDEYKKLMKDL